MGAWGAGLYSSDVAADLRSTMSSVLRLPLEPDEVVALLLAHEPALSDPDDEDYTDCWFVVADRFHRYGVVHEPTLTLVRELIDEGTDLDVKRSLGMQPADLRAREKVIIALRNRLGTPHPKPYRTGSMTRPQRYLVDVGDVLVYPTMSGGCFNPYATGRYAATYHFEADGYRAAVVLDRGRAFGYLAWYTMARLKPIWAEKPTMDQLIGSPLHRSGSGTMSKAHYDRMSMERVGSTDTTRLDLPSFDDPIKAAIQDVSICNRLRAAPSKPQGQLAPQPD